MASRFLSELPKELTERLSPDETAQVDLWADRYIVRDSARKNTYTGKTFNSIENIREFFGAKTGGSAAPAKGSTGSSPAPAARPAPATVRPAPPAGPAPKPANQPAAHGAPATRYPKKIAENSAKPVPRLEASQASLGFEARPQTAQGQNSSGTKAPAAGKPGGRSAEAPERDIRFRVGSSVIHSRYGRGTVVRREGEGDQAKVTVSFPGHGLKKLIEKFAGLKAGR